MTSRSSSSTTPARTRRGRAWWRSPGRSPPFAESAPRVRVFGLSRNFGQDAAITAGLAKARGRWVIVMDCDLQEPPEAVPELYARAQEGFEVVRTERAARGHSRLRRLASSIYRRLLLEETAHPEY